MSTLDVLANFGWSIEVIGPPWVSDLRTRDGRTVLSLPGLGPDSAIEAMEEALATWPIEREAGSWIASTSPATHRGELVDFDFGPAGITDASPQVGILYWVGDDLVLRRTGSEDVVFAGWSPPAVLSLCSNHLVAVSGRAPDQRPNLAIIDGVTREPRAVVALESDPAFVRVGGELIALGYGKQASVQTATGASVAVELRDFAGSHVADITGDDLPEDWLELVGIWPAPGGVFEIAGCCGDRLIAISGTSHAVRPIAHLPPFIRSSHSVGSTGPDLVAVWPEGIWRFNRTSHISSLATIDGLGSGRVRTSCTGDVAVASAGEVTIWSYQG